MKPVIKLCISASLLASASATHAGGLDRSLFGSSLLFLDGNAINFGINYVSPSVEGTLPNGITTGNIADSYFMLSMGLKADYNQFSFAAQYDAPYGAGVDYAEDSALKGIAADLSSNRFSLLMRYKVNDQFSLFGGPVLEQIGNASVEIPQSSYKLNTSGDTGFGYALGAAYEIPQSAMRAAVTYKSAIDHELDVTENTIDGTMEISTPQSLTLDLQTGINERTLLVGSIRWADWSETNITPPLYKAATGGSLIDYGSDVVTLTAGAGYQINNTIAILGSIAYEAASGDEPNLLAPTDGKTTLTAGVQYTKDASKIRAGLSYSFLGDVEGTNPIAYEFSDSSALGLGFSITQGF